VPAGAGTGRRNCGSRRLEKSNNSVLPREWFLTKIQMSNIRNLQMSEVFQFHK